MREITLCDVNLFVSQQNSYHSHCVSGE